MKNKDKRVCLIFMNQFQNGINQWIHGVVYENYVGCHCGIIVGWATWLHYGLGKLATSMAWGTWLHHGLGSLATSWLGEAGYINGSGNLATSWLGVTGYIIAWGTWLHLGLGKLATSKAVWHRPPAELSAVRTTGLTLTWFQLVYKRATLCILDTRNWPITII